MAATAPPITDSNVELVRWAVEQLNTRNLEGLREFWAPDAVERFPDRTCRGTEEITAYFKEVFAAIPDMHLETTGVAGQDEDVFVQWRLTGTHDGPLMGIAPTGKPLEIDGMDHFVVRDGKMVSNFVVFDQMQYARQLGMMPLEGSAPDKALTAVFNARTKLAGKLAARRSGKGDEGDSEGA